MVYTGHICTNCLAWGIVIVLFVQTTQNLIASGKARRETLDVGNLTFAHHGANRPKMVLSRPISTTRKA